MFKLYKQIQLLTAAGKGAPALLPNVIRGAVNVTTRNNSNGKWRMLKFGMIPGPFH